MALGYGWELLTLIEKVPGPGKAQKVMQSTPGSMEENQTVGSMRIVWPCGLTILFGWTSAAQ